MPDMSAATLSTLQPPEADYDIAIVGGGLVGLSLASALAQIDNAPRVLLLEAFDYQGFAPPGFDSRTLALSYSSRQIFSGLGLWQSLCQQVSAIHTIHISDRGHPGMTRLQASEMSVDALGYVIENRHLGECLYRHVSQLDTVTIRAPAKLVSLRHQDDRVQLTLQQAEQSHTVTCRLLVAADGSDSFVRQQLGIELKRLAYQQSAIIANVAVDRPHANRAYERFTHSGPMALLPLPGFEADAHRFGLVWTVPDSEVEQVMQLDDDTFAQALAQRFGGRVGHFTRIGKRSAYPLGLTYVSEHVQSRLALIGNAAHTLHPVAGQGFNLGLRDVAALAEIVKRAWQDGQDIGQLSVLQAYADWRRQDHRLTMSFTDALVRLFSNNFPPLVLARNAGLLAMDMLAPVRRRLTRHAMGYIGRASLLARGLDLHQ